jgi:membrane peptidoglycan carboxypeptidase
MKNGVYKKNNKKVFKKKSGVVRKILKHIGYLLIASILLVLFAIFYLFMTLEIPSIDKIEKNRLAQSTKIYDRTGEFLLYDFHGDERRTSIKFKDISKNIVNATIAIEDKEFRNHNGIVVRSIVKAAYENIVAGKKVRGASTITQQVVKNYILTREKTYIRKIKEAVLALKLEKIKTKDEIMEMYLNEISYGGQVYGIEEAARVYFGKPAADLSVLESAYLAGIPNAPSIYSPYISGNRKRLENRKNLILRLLSEQGYISDKELDDAKSSEVTFLAIGESNNMRAPHFTNYVIAQLKKMYSAEELINSGFKVYTTLN